MVGRETRKQQIAKRLGVSERVLEQYLQSKRAEVAARSDEEAAPPRLERRERASRERPLG